MESNNGPKHDVLGEAHGRRRCNDPRRPHRAAGGSEREERGLAVLHGSPRPAIAAIAAVTAIAPAAAVAAARGAAEQRGPRGRAGGGVEGALLLALGLVLLLGVGGPVLAGGVARLDRLVAAGVGGVHSVGVVVVPVVGCPVLWCGVVWRIRGAGGGHVGQSTTKRHNTQRKNTTSQQ